METRSTCWMPSLSGGHVGNVSPFTKRREKGQSQSPLPPNLRCVTHLQPQILINLEQQEQRDWGANSPRVTWKIHIPSCHWMWALPNLSFTASHMTDLFLLRWLPSWRVIPYSLFHGGATHLLRILLHEGAVAHCNIRLQVL
jgi:hypothetical protein